MIFHVHYSFSENSGEIRRIKNIDRDLVSYLSRDEIEIVFISPALFFRKKYEKFKLRESVRKKFYFPAVPFSYSKLFFMKLNSFWTSFILWLLYLFYKPQYIVSEYSISYQSLRFIPSSVFCIIDIHGAQREEYEYSVKNHRKSISDYYDYLEYKGILKARGVICQSDEMRKHLLRKYPNLDEAKFCVYRCTADATLFFYNLNDREAIRRDMSLSEDQCLFVYAGGLHRWQKVEESLRLFEQYLTACDSRAKFLLLTLAKDQAKELIEIKFPNIKDSILVKSVSNAQVRLYLSAADVAFLLRDDVVMNAVAFPTKLAEYMFCGLPVISTSVAKKWIDCDRFIYNIDICGITNLGAFLSQVNRVEVADYAQKNLSLDFDKQQLITFLDGFKK